MGQGSVAPWPPEPGSTPELAAAAARAVLEGVGVGNIADIRVKVAHPWRVTVTLGDPDPGAVARIRAALAPARTEVIWHVASFERVTDATENEGLAGGPEGDGSCGICRTPAPVWHHTLPAGEPGPVAFAGHWFLCSECHARVVRADTAGLAARARSGDLAPDQATALAARLVAGQRHGGRHR